MANVTLAIEDDILRRARIRAVTDGTSVNAVVREYLRRYAGDDASRAALQEFARLAAARRASSGGGGRTWTRDELHDR
jgi:plasmid stability protein